MATNLLDLPGCYLGSESFKIFVPGIHTLEFRTILHDLVREVEFFYGQAKSDSSWSHVFMRRKVLPFSCLYIGINLADRLNYSQHSKIGWALGGQFAPVARSWTTSSPKSGTQAIR